MLGSLTKLASLTIPKSAIQVESNLLKALEKESETLQNITDQFAPLMSNFRIYFFWEQEKTDLKYTKDYIVDEASAAPILDNTERCGIAADHRGICKFGTPTAQGFRTVVAALRRYSQEAPQVIRGRWIKSIESLGESRRYEAMEMLKGIQAMPAYTHGTDSLRTTERLPNEASGQSQKRRLLNDRRNEALPDHIIYAEDAFDELKELKGR